MIREIKMPEIGENVESGMVVAVYIKIGDMIAADDTIIELETDKALVEIPSPFAGTVTQVFAEAGREIKVGEVIARVDLAEDESIAEPDSDEKRPEPEKEAEREALPSTSDDEDDGEKKKNDFAEVVEGAATRKPSDDQSVSISQRAVEASPLPDFGQWGDVEIIKMETVRRLTAQRTAASWEIIPHVTQFDEADVTNVLSFKEKYAKRAKNTGAKMTLTAIITCRCAMALKRYPMFNASIDTAGNRIILKKYIHIGIAVDTPRGLLAPVIRDADQKSIVELAVSISDLALRARSKKIKPDEMKGGTFSISNQGGIGGVGFTPIVLWPQVATLGMSRTTIKPVYVDGRFEPRTTLPLSLSYDHRIIDGADAARFLRWICDGLESPTTMIWE